MGVRDDAADLADELVMLRRELHRIPEIGLDLPLTQRRVVQALYGLPLRGTTGTALTAVAAAVRGGRAGPVVLLRGDMDAFRLTDPAGEFSSRHPGIMHACGH